METPRGGILMDDVVLLYPPPVYMHLWFQHKKTGRLPPTDWHKVEGEFVQYHTVWRYLSG